MSAASEREMFVITLRAERNVPDPIRSLRALLKATLRRYGMRCIDIRRHARGCEP
jgi:hypothetical protein